MRGGPQRLPVHRKLHAWSSPFSIPDEGALRPVGVHRVGGPLFLLFPTPRRAAATVRSLRRTSLVARVAGAGPERHLAWVEGAGDFPGVGCASRGLCHEGDSGTRTDCSILEMLAKERSSHSHRRMVGRLSAGYSSVDETPFQRHCDIRFERLRRDDPPFPGITCPLGARALNP